MDITNLKNNGKKLVTHMKNNNYSKTYIDKIQNELNQLIKYGSNYDSYLDYYENYIRKISIERNKRHRLDLLTIIMNFDIYGLLPNRHRNKHKIIDNSNYAKLNSEFKQIIDKYIQISQTTGKKATTIKNEARNATVFLMYLQNKEIHCIENITEDNVLSFFMNNKNELIYSCSYKKNIRAVFKACAPHIIGCKRIMEYLPKMKEVRKNIQFLTKDEVKKIKTVLDDKDTNISLRHKAIVTILLYTGLRSCDIVNLKLQNIDWTNETINITQTKTNVELQLPLLPVVGNALYEYLKAERPLTDMPYLFLRLDCNFPITRSTVKIAVSKIMDKANIRMKKGERRGTHIFRYNLATTLLENNVPQPVITQTLGHTSPDSLEAYLKADITHLRQCALSVEQFTNVEVTKNG